MVSRPLTASRPVTAPRLVRKARLWFALCSCLAVASFSSEATPCGAFVARATKVVPSLQVEQTLILFDPERGQEHFIRSIAIRDPSPGFGFVVPVPEKPVVAKIAKSPFERLAARFPVREFVPGFSSAGRLGGGHGSGEGVAVLSRSRIGSFTAFVLTASDTRALQKWFDDNQLVVPDHAQSWLAHYVKLGFYFAALRYEQQASDVGSQAVRAETLRISFASPLPYYPYREPAHAPPSSLPRELAVWLVSTREYTPLSLFEPAASGGVPHFVRPLAQHGSDRLAREELRTFLGDELRALLPGDRDDTSLTIQTFEDQKRSRAGFGDIVMVPQLPGPPPPLGSSRKLMASLDPQVTP
ncbi:MAG TPA: DUF2330 domain-containing protein [Polyangiaceae bacterium]|nr:DUF2330 domain-containing protein [Polyangiaceae bacterium]